MRVHFIAIGGAAMHNLALALKEKDYFVTGSDDAIFNPSKYRLEKAGICPNTMGWFPDKINNDINAVIVGMHARADNPELLKAQELNLTIYSYPEYLYEQAKNKTRIVIGGSHGKTTITSMILHVFQTLGLDCDYMVGAQLAGFTTMVKLSNAPIIVLEGDEYLSSPIDLRPKFHLYKPHIALLSGIAWDHINVFPTFQNYLEQFDIFIKKIEPKGYLTFCSSDAELTLLVGANPDVKSEAYHLPSYDIRDGITYLNFTDTLIPLEIFGEHNLKNMMGAFNVCKQLDVSHDQFFAAMSSFKGASNRLERIFLRDGLKVYKDFAHSPSKVRATVKAVKSQFQTHKVIAVLELHTYSSLTISFLSEYKNAMNGVEVALVYFDPKAIAHKKLAGLPERLVFDSFNRSDLKVVTNSTELCEKIETEISEKAIVLFMSSGNFGGLNLEVYSKTL